MLAKFTVLPCHSHTHQYEVRSDYNPIAHQSPPSLPLDSSTLTSWRIPLSVWCPEGVAWGHFDSSRHYRLHVSRYPLATGKHIN